MEKVIYTKKLENAAQLVAVTEVRLFTPSESDKERYFPFNQLLITNNSAVDIEIRPNGDSDKAIIVPAGVGITDNSNAFQFITLYNRDAAVAVEANEVIILVRKVVDV